MPNPDSDSDVTIFFRGSDTKWRSSNSDSKPLESNLESYEKISKDDIDKLEKIKICLMQLREEARKEGKVRTRKGLLKVFDNYAMSLFIEELALILDDIQTHGTIKDYIGKGKAVFTIEVDLEED